MKLYLALQRIERSEADDISPSVQESEPAEDCSNCSSLM